MSAEREQHVVRITRNPGQERRNDIMAFIAKNVTRFRGKLDGGPVEGTHGVPEVIFERESNAHAFAGALSRATDFPREHIEVKPRDMRQAARADGVGSVHNVHGKVTKG